MSVFGFSAETVHRMRKTPRTRSKSKSMKRRTYGYLDKVLSIEENGETLTTFDYHVDGQLARATRGGRSETFLWDGLALI